MGRRSFGLGEHGEIEATPQCRDASGKWKRASNPRSAERWRARAYYRGHDGVVRDVSRVGKYKREAIRAAEIALRDRLAAGDLTMSTSTLLVAAGELWLRRIKRSDSGLSRRTIEEYEYAFRRYVDIPGSPVRGLTISQANDPQRLRGFQERVADNHGTGSAKMTRTVLSGILGLAVESGVLTANAMRQLRPVRSQTPKVRVRDHSRAFTRAEREELISYADKLAMDETLHPSTARKRQATADLIAFLAGTGVRVGEARLLLWEHVDLTHAFVNIHGTKSLSSRRRLPLPWWLVDRLRLRVERVGSRGLVFASPHHINDPERAWDQSNLSKAVRSVIDGCEMTWAVPHSFRRTVASWLHDAGVPLVDIADQLGHSNPAMTASVYLRRDFLGAREDVAGHL